MELKGEVPGSVAGVKGEAGVSGAAVNGDLPVSGTAMNGDLPESGAAENGEGGAAGEFAEPEKILKILRFCITGRCCGIVALLAGQGTMDQFPTNVEYP